MPEKTGGPAPEEGKLFIGGLTYSTTDEMLKDYYSQFGRLVDFIVMKDPGTKRSRGFGFVTFADRVCADIAMASIPHVLDGKTVEAKRATPRESDPSESPSKSMKTDKGPPVKRLFLSGVKEEHDESMFHEYFGQYGTVLDVEIVIDKMTGRKRGFGYVTFDAADAVEKCTESKSHMIGGLRCDVKKALTRDELGKTSNQYGRDRQERDARSRGSGRGDGYNFGGNYQNNYGAGGYNSGSWNTTGYWPNGPAMATYYPPAYGNGNNAMQQQVPNFPAPAAQPRYGAPANRAPAPYAAYGQPGPPMGYGQQASYNQQQQQGWSDPNSSTPAAAGYPADPRLTMGAASAGTWAPPAQGASWSNYPAAQASGPAQQAAAYQPPKTVSYPQPTPNMYQR